MRRRFSGLLLLPLLWPAGLHLVPAAASASPGRAPASTCDGLPATLVGTAGDDTLAGTDGPDVIAGLAGDDTLVGGGGDDVLCGDAGTDVLRGGAGDDRLLGGLNGLRPSEDNPPDNVGDTLEGGPGDDHLDPGADTETDQDGGFLPETVSFEHAAAGVQVDLAAGTATGEGDDVIVFTPTYGLGLMLIGSPYADVLQGSSAQESFLGLGGDDVVRGRAGDDGLADADDGADTADDDTFDGGPGRDFLAPGAGDDVVRGGSGSDQIEDYRGAPRVDAGRGRDSIGVRFGAHAALPQAVDGGPGAHDHLIFSVRGRRASGTLDLPAERIRFDSTQGRGRAALRGIESVIMPNGVWRFRGTAADEWVDGGLTRASRLIAHGGAGRDRLVGTPGRDRLIGGPGRDRAEGLGGVDVCRAERTLNCERR